MADDLGTADQPVVAAPLTRRKRIAFTAVLGCLPLTVLLIVAGLYYTWSGWQNYQANRGEYQGRSFIASAPTIGYAGRAGANIRHLTAPVFSVYSDSRGCRADAPDEVAPKQVDLLAVGCSFTFGFGVDNPDTYIHRVADALDRTMCNAAVPAYGTTAALLSVGRFADLAPKVIVYGFIGTHETRNLVPCATTNEPFCRQMAFVDLHSGQPEIVPAQQVSATDEQYLTDALQADGFGFQDVYWAVMRDWYRFTGRAPARVNAPYAAAAADPVARSRAVGFLVDALAGKAAALGARLVVVYMPIPGDVRPMPESLKAALARHPDIPVADVTSAFQAYEAEHGPQSLRIKPDDAHPNAAAHALIAAAAEPVVAEALAQPTKR